MDERYEADFYLSNFDEYEQGSTEPIVRGRMKANIAFWREIGAPDEILGVIDSGYRIPFLFTPPPAVFKNNKSARDNPDFVTEAVLDLMRKNLVSELLSVPEYINPLSVSVQSSGKKRLILDLRYINEYVWKQKVRFEDWEVALEYFQQGDYMFSFDLKSGYHHIDIFEEHCKYLCFSWELDGKVRYFSFRVLPFGLSTAPYIFTKTMRPLVKHWRSKDVFVVVFLDDGWFRAPSFLERDRVAKLVKSDLLLAGLVPNVEKSVWTPTQEIEWLGLSWDAKEGTLRAKRRRVEDLMSCIESIIIDLPYSTPRKLASFVGKAISLLPVVRHMVQLRTRFSSMIIAESNHWDKKLSLASRDKVIEELFFWKENVERLNLRHVFRYSLPQVFVFSDASHVG